MQPSTARCVTGTAKQVRCERLDETIWHSLRDAEQFAKKRQSSQTSTQTKKPSFPRASVTSKCLIWLVARARFELATWVMSSTISLCRHVDLRRFWSGAIVITQSETRNLQPAQQLTQPTLSLTNDTEQTLGASPANQRHRQATKHVLRVLIVLPQIVTVGFEEVGPSRRF